MQTYPKAQFSKFMGCLLELK